MIIENVEECVLDCDIKKVTWVVVQDIASNLAPFSSVATKEAMTQGVCTNLVVKYVVPNITRFSKDIIVEGKFLFGLVQSLLKVKLPNTTHSKISYKTCLLNSPCQFEFKHLYSTKSSDVESASKKCGHGSSLLAIDE